MENKIPHVNSEQDKYRLILPKKNVFLVIYFRKSVRRKNF